MNTLDDKTARCILVGEAGYLLVQHSNCSPENRGTWALPGGKIEAGEDALTTLHRELEEELFIAVEIERLVAVGRYEYKERRHRVFAAEFQGEIERWDPAEIAAIGWFSLAEIEALEDEQRLHTGFEARAIRELESQAFALSG